MVLNFISFIKNFLCHPFVESKRAYVIPEKVEKLHSTVFENGEIKTDDRLDDAKQRCLKGLASLRKDHRRRVNPTPYKVSLSQEMYSFLHEKWLECNDF